MVVSLTTVRWQACVLQEVSTVDKPSSLIVHTHISNTMAAQTILKNSIASLLGFFAIVQESSVLDGCCCCLFACLVVCYLLSLLFVVVVVAVVVMVVDVVVVVVVVVAVVA